MTQLIDRVNLGTSLVATAPSPATSGTSLVCTAAQGSRMPRTPFLAIAHPDGSLPTRDNAEIVLVTAVSTDTFTIVRARDGTSALSIAVGWRITAIMAANHVSENGSLYENAMLNGGMDIWQRATTFTTPNNDTYGPDRWNFLQEANGAWTFSQSTDVPDGFTYSMKAVNVTANKQAGIVQILENIDSKKFTNQYVSLSFWAKTTTSKVISNLRATILSWNSTPDVVTSDVMGTWAQDGTDPTFATNWTKEVAGSNLALVAGTWQQYTVENILIDTASMANIALVIWVDDGTITANDEFYITGIKVNQGRFAMPFQPRNYIEELQRCRRYCYSFTTAGSAQTPVGMGWGQGTTSISVRLPVPVAMRVIPTLIATASDWQVFDGVNAGVDVSALSIGSDPAATTDDVWLRGTVSGGTSNRPYALRGDGGGTRQLIVDAEL